MALDSGIVVNQYTAVSLNLTRPRQELEVGIFRALPKTGINSKALAKSAVPTEARDPDCMLLKDVPNDPPRGCTGIYRRFQIYQR